MMIQSWLNKLRSSHSPARFKKKCIRYVRTYVHLVPEEAGLSLPLSSWDMTPAAPVLCTCCQEDVSKMAQAFADLGVSEWKGEVATASNGERFGCGSLLPVSLRRVNCSGLSDKAGVHSIRGSCTLAHERQKAAVPHSDSRTRKSQERRRRSRRLDCLL